MKWGTPKSIQYKTETTISSLRSRNFNLMF